MRRELGRGAIAGAAGGAALAIVLLAAGEGPLQRAIDREGPGGDALVSRAGQRAGGVIAAILVGLALGVILAMVAEMARRRRAGNGKGLWWDSLGLAGAAFLALNLVPFMKYPANPPGVDGGDSIGTRTGAFLVLVAWSLLVSWASWRGWRWLGARRVPPALAVPVLALAALALVAVAYLVLPPATDPGAVPAGELWTFRTASLGAWAAYWAVAGTVLALLRLPAGALGRARLGGSRTPV